MSVYIELVLFNNFAIDFLLIVCVQIVRRRKLRKARVIFASAVGSAVAALYAISPEWGQIAVKILLSPLLTLMFDRYGDKTGFRKWIKDFLKSLAAFVIFTYLLGGVVFGLSFAFKTDINSYATLGVSALGIAIVLLIARAAVHKKSVKNKKICDATIRIGAKTVCAKALCDSGNLLTDPLSGLPIVIVSKQVEDSFADCKIQGFVNVSTVNGEDSMPIIYLDEISVDGTKYRAYGALARKNFDDVGLILQNSMF